MKKILVFSLFSIVLLMSDIKAQNLVASYPFIYNNPFNYFWGVTSLNDTLWIGTDYDGSGYPFAKLYKVTKNGIIIDSLVTPYTFNHGLAWDGSGFWIAEDYRSSGGRLYKIGIDGSRLDSIYTTSATAGIGGIALDGNNLWIAVYYPDFSTYPFAYAYKMNLTTRQIIDTIPLRGKQVQGIAVKGDTILYVTDNFQGDQERIYGFRKAVGDTIFSFPAPDPDNDCDPRGLYWDGSHLYLIAYRIGNNVSAYRVLYKYGLTGMGSPQITTSSSMIDFGNVNIGNTSNQNLSITNTGTANLIITGKSISNPVFSIVPNNTPDTLLPNQTKNYTVSFTPNAFDTTSGILSLLSNDMATPIKNITLKGKGVQNGAFISLSSTNYDYSNRRVNSLCGFIFTVQNQGSSQLQISNITFNTPRYRLDTVGLSFPIMIDTQRTTSLRVWFNPNSPTVFKDTVKIFSNAVNLPLAKISLSGTGSSTITALGDIMWQANTPDNPFTSVDDFQPISMKQINDVNNDGINDIIVCSGNYYTACWNGNSSVTGDLLWLFNTGYNNNNTGSVVWEDGMQIRDDVDGDGIQDVVFGCGGGNEMVYTISGRTGRLIWFYGDSINYSTGDIEAVRVDKDYNGDGVKDVLVSASGTGTGTGGRHALICLNGLNGAVLFYVTQGSEFTGDIISSQFGGAQGLGNNSGIYSVVGFNNTGGLTWTYNGVNGKTWNMKLIPSINADTVKEILGYYGFSGKVFCIASDNGTELWSISLGSANAGFLKVLDDLDSNGSPEFTLSGPQSLYRVDSKTHNILWTNSVGASYIRGVDFLSDVNGDGKRDIAYSMQTPGYIYVVNGVNGNILFQYSFGSTVSYRADRVTALNSIDGNSTTEFVGGCRDGRLVCFSGGPNIPTNIKPLSQVKPEKFIVQQNYPNPFNPITKIAFSIPSENNVTISVFDVSGRKIIESNLGRMQAGSYEYLFNGENLTSGIYFYKINLGMLSETKKMILLK